MKSYVYFLLLLCCYSCMDSTSLQNSSENEFLSAETSVDPELYLKLVQDKQFLEICNLYKNNSLPRTKTDSELNRLISAYEEKNGYENLEDYIVEYNEVASGLANQWNMFISQANLLDMQLLQIYFDHGKQITLDAVQEKLYGYISKQDHSAGRVYKDLRITKEYISGHTYFENDDEVISYLFNFGVSASNSNQVLWTISSSYSRMKDIIYEELNDEKPSTDTIPDRPHKPSEGGSPRIYDYTLKETIEKTRIGAFYLEELKGWRGAPIDTNLVLINTSCLVDHYQALYTYNDFSCSDAKKAEAFRSLIKFDYKKEYSIFLETVVSNGSSHTMYLFLVDKSGYQVSDYIEAGIWYDKGNKKYRIKDWMINNNMELIVGELRVTSPEKFEDDINSLEVERILTKYSITNRFTMLEQKSFGSRVLTNDLLMNPSPIANDF